MPEKKKRTQNFWVPGWSEFHTIRLRCHLADGMFSYPKRVFSRTTPALLIPLTNHLQILETSNMNGINYFQMGVLSFFVHVLSHLIANRDLNGFDTIRNGIWPWKMGTIFHQQLVSTRISTQRYQKFYQPIWMNYWNSPSWQKGHFGYASFPGCWCWDSPQNRPANDIISKTSTQTSQNIVVQNDI